MKVSGCAVVCGSVVVGGFLRFVEGGGDPTNATLLARERAVRREIVPAP